MKIKLSKKLYKKKPIEDTCKTYKEAGLGDFKMLEKEDYFLIEATDVEGEWEEIKNEFLNYVISESQSII
jgi:hypothetical protein